MAVILSCPRCGSAVQPPSAWSSSWRCDQHGDILPLRQVQSLSHEGLTGLLRNAAVPVMLPWPLPDGWLVTGFAGAGDERSGTRGCVVALSGPNPVGGPGELLVVSEEPGMGLGAYCAGVEGPDPGAGFAARSPHAQVECGNHEFPLWHVDAPGCAAFAGELMGGWLWILLWPDTAGTLLLEPMHLWDLRDRSQDLDLPFGARSPRLPGESG
ncbi:MAG TPA: DUF6758 family protein [Streptosporangiaceae bacterium]|nr:DUF6758 family protein [Streptosporangiaceae bacterium]